MFRTLSVFAAIAITLSTVNADCGRLSPSKPKIIGGNKTHYGSEPWNVGIYQKNHDVYEIISGGTLISANLVLSVAHCFWTEDLNNFTFKNDDKYKVAVGKYSSDISIKDNPYTEIIDVEFIYLEEDYYGDLWFYANDIAILKLSTDVKISDFVLPVCIDWKKKYTVSNGDVGKFVGWGRMEDKNLRPHVLEGYLTYIDRWTCRNQFKNEFIRFITKDKFCANHHSGQKIFDGDSGAGLTFVHDNLYFLTGIVSLKERNSKKESSLVVFTDVGAHIQWIQKIYTDITNDNVCGRLSPSKSKITDGNKAYSGTEPWNVGIYQKQHDVYEIMNGGTLISANLVLSVAHGFWTENLKNVTIKNDGKYKVAVGKYSSDISIKDNPYTEIIDVELIYLEEDFYGDLWFYANDIAILKLSTYVKISDFVMPVCMDWNKKYSVSNGDVGKFISWGRKEDKTLRPFELQGYFTYIDRFKCRDRFQRNESIRYITKDKFCASHHSGHQAVIGDSGAGLTFLHDDLYFLTGITSLSDTNSINESLIVFFTNVDAHIQWIQKIYTDITNDNEKTTNIYKKSDTFEAL